MDIKLDELKIIADQQGFALPILEKDYLVTLLLYLLKDIKGIHFKSGTSINKKSKTTSHRSWLAIDWWYDLSVFQSQNKVSLYCFAWSLAEPYF